ncbi:MAG: AraC family transcriptional regulator [Bacillota bacterium]
MGPVYIDHKLSPYGIILQESRHSRDFRMVEHYHQIFQVFYVLGGEGVCRLGGVEHKLVADTAVLVGGGVPHLLIDRPDDPLFLFVLAFSADAVRYHPEHTQLLSAFAGRTTVVGPGEPALASVKEGLRRILYEQSARRPGYPIGVRAELLSILLQLYRLTLPEDGRALVGGVDPADRPVYEVKRYLDQHFYEPLRVEAMARLAHLSPRQLGERFRRLTGRTLIQYLTTVRVEQAKHILRTTDEEIIAVCFEVGYDNLSHFYRVFKKNTGLTPKRFRQERQEGGPIEP